MGRRKAWLGTVCSSLASLFSRNVSAKAPIFANRCASEQEGECSSKSDANTDLTIIREVYHLDNYHPDKRLANVWVVAECWADLTKRFFVFITKRFIKIARSVVVNVCHDGICQDGRPPV